MIAISNIALIAIHLVVIRQDFRTRSIHWLVVPGLLLACCIWRMANTSAPWADVWINWTILAIQGLVLTIYFSIKNGTWTNPVNTLIGLGDILYLAIVALAFNTTFFILFLVSGFLFSLVSYLLYIQLNRGANREIPLAGLLSLWLIIILILQHFQVLAHPFFEGVCA